MDSKLKALAAEYEKARKQNIQLRTALQQEKEKSKSYQREIEEFKSNQDLSSNGDVSTSNQIESLRIELDQKEKLNSKKIRELESIITKLENDNLKLKNDQIVPPNTEDIGIQKNEEISNNEKEELLQETIDGLNAKIIEIHTNHEVELKMIMREKRIVQPEVVIPKELTIIDQSDLGHDSNSMTTEVSSLTDFFESRIESLILQLQKEISRAQYSSCESRSALARLRHAEDDRHDLIGQLRKSRDQKTEVENEMETIKRSYEEQLNTMTEELALQLSNGSAPSVNAIIEEDQKSTKKSRFSLFSRNSS